MTSRSIVEEAAEQAGRPPERAGALAEAAYQWERALESDGPGPRAGFARAAGIWLIADVHRIDPMRRAVALSRMVGIVRQLGAEEERGTAHVLGELAAWELRRESERDRLLARALARQLAVGLKDAYPSDPTLATRLAFVPRDPVTSSEFQAFVATAASVAEQVRARERDDAMTHQDTPLEPLETEIPLPTNLVLRMAEVVVAAARVGQSSEYRVAGLLALIDHAAPLTRSDGPARKLFEQTLELLAGGPPLNLLESRAFDRVLRARVAAVARPGAQAPAPGEWFACLRSSRASLSHGRRAAEIVSFAGRLARLGPPSADADLRASWPSLSGLHAVMWLAARGAWGEVRNALAAAGIPRREVDARSRRAAAGALIAWAFFARVSGSSAEEKSAAAAWDAYRKLNPDTRDAALAGARDERAREAWLHAELDGDVMAAELLLTAVLSEPGADGDAQLAAELAKQRANDSSGFWAHRAAWKPVA